MDRFEDLRCFVQVVDRGSVTRAAEALGVAPSAVSRRIKELEARLGSQLLLRTTRRLSVTEAGRAFHARAQRLLADLEEAEAEVSDHHAALKGTLRLAAPLAFGTAHLTPILADFMREHPGVAIDLDLSDRLTDLVAEGFELGIRIGTLRDSSLIARKVCDVRRVVCAAPSLIAERGLPQHPRELKDWPALCYVGSERPDIWRYRTPEGVQESMPMQVRIKANHGGLLADLAVAGLGVCIEPSFLVDRHVATGRLVPLLCDYDWTGVGLYMVYPETRHLSARARALIEFVRGRTGPKPYWESFLEPAAGG